MMSTEPTPALDPDQLKGLSREEYCYLTSRGRLTGRPHEIEIWFALRGRTLYFLSGGGEASDWVKNMRLNPQVTARLAGRTFRGQARFALGEAEERNAREWLTGKYQGWRLGHRMSEWGRTALPVAVDLMEELG